MLATQFHDEHLQFARSVAKQVMSRFKASPHYYDEYVSAAYYGLIEAASRYDRKSDVPFERYAYLRVRGAVIDHLRKDSGQGRYEYKATQLMQAGELLLEDFYKTRNSSSVREPSKDLADVLEFAARGGLVFRLNYLECEEELVEAGQVGADPDEALHRKNKAEMLRELVASLPEKERIVIECLYLEGLSLQEIAEDRLQVTRSWVSRVHTRALKHLKQKVSGVPERAKRRRRRKKNEGV